VYYLDMTSNLVQMLGEPSVLSRRDLSSGSDVRLEPNVLSRYDL
jgi:hypothetical protein